MKYSISLSFILIMAVSFYSHATGRYAEVSNAPKSVSVGLMVLDVHQIDNIEESITGEFVLFMRWKDTSLCVPGQQEVIRISFEEAGAPQVQVKNLQEIQTFSKRTVEVSPQGIATFRHRFIGHIRQQFDFKRFPFDVQDWVITLFYSGVSEFRFVPDQEYQGLMDANNPSISSWQIDYLGQKASLITNFGFPIQALEITYILRRDPVFYIWKVVIPIVLVVLMSWSVFWINPTNISAQLTVSVTAILTLIAFQFSVAQLMPPLPYLTKLDKFTTGADIFVFLAFVETIITSYSEDHHRLKVAVAIDYYSRFIFPIAFAVFVAITLW